MGVVLVQVRHRGHEPSFDSLLQVHLRGIGIHYRSQLIRCLQIGTLCGLRAVAVGSEACHRVATALFLREPIGSVQPILRRHVLSPRMLKTTVIEDHVHHDLQSLLVGLVAEQFVVLVRAEARIHLVVVCRGVAVISGKAVLRVWRVVLQHGREPQGRHAELFEVVQVLTDAVQIAAMPQ